MVNLRFKSCRLYSDFGELNKMSNVILSILKSRKLEIYFFKVKFCWLTKLVRNRQQTSGVGNVQVSLDQLIGFVISVSVMEHGLEAEKKAMTPHFSQSEISR